MSSICLMCAALFGVSLCPQCQAEMRDAIAGVSKTQHQGATRKRDAAEATPKPPKSGRREPDEDEANNS